MWHLLNLQTNKYLTDEYGHVIAFFNGNTAVEYYERYCIGMINVVLKREK